MKKTYTQKAKASALLCFLAGAAAMNSKAAVLYFDPSGATAPTTGSTYTWNTTSSQWATTHTLNAGIEAWVSSDAACFTASSGFAGTITVDVGTGVSCAGIFNGSLNPDGVFLTIQGGSLNMIAGTDAISTGGSDGAPTTILSVMTGAGQIETESGQSVNLYAANTYTGGTLIGGGGGVNFNNSSSFGSGTITWGHSTMVLASQGSSPLTIGNAMATATGDTLIFVGGATAPTTFNGAWALASGGTSTLQVNAGTPLTMPGIISGSGTLALTGAGTLILSGANTMTGGLSVTGTLTAGNNNVFSSISTLTLNGGTLNMNGYNQTTTGTLTLTANSTINFLSGTETLSIANSSPVAWTAGKTLAITGYGMIAGTGQSDGNWYVGVGGLTTAQLAEITIDGESGAYITQAGDALGAGLVEVPEPSTLALGAMGGLGMLWMIKRRKTA